MYDVIMLMKCIFTIFISFVSIQRFSLLQYLEEIKLNVSADLQIFTFVVVDKLKRTQSKIMDEEQIPKVTEYYKEI